MTTICKTVKQKTSNVRGHSWCNTTCHSQQLFSPQALQVRVSRCCPWSLCWVDPSNEVHVIVESSENKTAVLFHLQLHWSGKPTMYWCCCHRFIYMQEIFQYHLILVPSANHWKFGSSVIVWLCFGCAVPNNKNRVCGMRDSFHRQCEHNRDKREPHSAVWNVLNHTLQSYMETLLFANKLHGLHKSHFWSFMLG